MAIASVLFFIDYANGSRADIYPAVMYGIFSIVFLFQSRKHLSASEES